GRARTASRSARRRRAPVARVLQPRGHAGSGGNPPPGRDGQGGRRGEMSGIATRYLGLTLKSPLVASASPLCESGPYIRELEDAGMAAVVLPSLFEEQIELEGNALDDDLWRGAESYPESQSSCSSKREGRTTASMPASSSSR